MYKTLGFKWLIEGLNSASAFATADKEEARNPQRFIPATVGNKPEKILQLTYKFTIFVRNLILRLWKLN